MDERTQNLIDECKRQQESCLYTSTTLFEWLKSLRFWKTCFVVAPIIFGAVATWPLLAHLDTYKWVTGVCALLAGVTPAVYKALDFDVSLGGIGKNANELKTLHDRFRQAWCVSALGSFSDFKEEFDDLMKRHDTARSTSFIPPERFFKKARAKIEAGHYDFAVDSPKPTGSTN
ncbi:MAG: hypothetical protein JST77_17480 [Acidobacteria bacterium]|nr:hypothetical protein [Acidobacteriota bacterium]